EEQAEGAGEAQEEESRESADDVLARERWFYGQREFPRGVIPAGARLQALRRRLQMQAEETAKARAMAHGGVGTLPAASSSTWTLVGPQPVSSPSPTGSVSGRVSALAVDPTNSSVVYLGAAQGGVWKTTNGGTSWTPLTDNQPSLSTGSLA